MWTPGYSGRKGQEWAVLLPTTVVMKEVDKNF